MSVSSSLCKDIMNLDKLFSSILELGKDTNVAEAVKIMAQHNILSVPVMDVDAPENASWIDRYLGVIEFAGTVVWILHQSQKKDGLENTDFIPESEPPMSPAVARAASGMSFPRYKGANPFDWASISGDFFEALTNSEFYKNAKKRIAGLHQVTSIRSTDITDTWEPLEEGLLPLETTRHVSMITITLSKEELDTSAAGSNAVGKLDISPSQEAKHVSLTVESQR